MNKTIELNYQEILELFYIEKWDRISKPPKGTDFILSLSNSVDVYFVKNQQGSLIYMPFFNEDGNNEEALSVAKEHLQIALDNELIKKVKEQI